MGSGQETKGSGGLAARWPVLDVPLVRGLTTGEACSSVGTAMTVVAIAYLSYADSKSVVNTVLVAAAFSLPTAVLGMAAGRVAARVSHRRLLFLCNLLKLLLFVTMAALAAADVLTFPVLVVASVLSGTISAFSTPAWMELGRDVIPPDQLDEANAFITAAASGAAVVGAFVGGALLGAVGAWSLFLLGGLSFLAFLWVLGRAHPQEIDTRNEHRARLRDVIRYVSKHEVLRRTFVRAALLSLFVAPVAQLLPAIAHQLDADSSTLGVLTGAFAVGAMALAWVIGTLRARYTRVAILNITFLVSGVVLVVFGRFGDVLEGHALWVVVLGSLIPLGLLLALAQSVLNAIVEVRVDPEKEGTVFALYAIVFTLLAPLGGFALGQFADLRDVWGSLTVAGTVVVVGSVLTLVFWNRPPDAATADGTPAPRSHHFFPVDALLLGHLLHVQRRRWHTPRADTTSPGARPE
jgi:MFS family permease